MQPIMPASSSDFAGQPNVLTYNLHRRNEILDTPEIQVGGFIRLDTEGDQHVGVINIEKGIVAAGKDGGNILSRRSHSGLYITPIAR